MNIWSKFKASLYTAYASWKSASFDFSAWQGRKFWGIDNSQLATNETIFSVITRISNTMSSLPIKLYQKFDVVDNDLSDLLIEPNPNMTGWELINKLEVARNEHGNSYAVILRDHRMQPVSILVLDNMQVSPFLNTDSGELWYEISAEKGTRYVHNMNVIHLKHITGASRLEGISPLKVLKNALQYDKAVQEFSLNEMEKKESFTLEYGANVSKEKQKQVIANFRQFYAENGGVLFKEPGVSIEKMQKTYNAGDTASSEKITRTRVANVFNVPLSFLNEQGGSFASNEQLMTQFVQTTLMPIIRQYENEFNRKLLTREQRKQGFYFKFSVNGLLRGDTAARTAYYQAAIRNGWLSQDDVRRYEDEPPVGGNASKLWVSGDLYPIDMPIEERKGTSTASTTVEGGEKDEKENIL